METPPTAPTDDDDQLMIRLQEGDGSAFDEIVDRHQRTLWGFFFKNTRDAQLSEDLTQDTLLKVYNQFWDYLPSGRFRGWMFRIARNLLIDDVRKRSHDALIRAIRHGTDPEKDVLQQIAQDIVPPEVEIEEEEFKETVNELLSQIPDDQRQTFTMHHFAGLSLPDVADAMDVPLATCKSRLRLAREKLVEKLDMRGIRATAGSATKKPVRTTHRK